MEGYTSYYFGERFVGDEAINKDAAYLGGQLNATRETTLDKMGEAFNVISLLSEAEEQRGVEIPSPYNIDSLFKLAIQSESNMLEGIRH